MRFLIFGKRLVTSDSVKTMEKGGKVYVLVFFLPENSWFIFLSSLLVFTLNVKERKFQSCLQFVDMKPPWTPLLAQIIQASGVGVPILVVPSCSF